MRSNEDPMQPRMNKEKIKEKEKKRKDTCTPVFIAVLYTVAKIWMQTKCPSTDE